MSEVIAIVSGKGGVGKTTVTANIGTALAAMGYKVLLIDADVGLRNLDIALGMQDRIVYHFLDLMDEACSEKQAIINDEKYTGLSFLAAPQCQSLEVKHFPLFKKMTDKLKTRYDYIIIDCPAGIDKGFLMAVNAADKVIIVSTPDMLSVRDADKVAAMSEKFGIEKSFLIINKINVDMIKKGDMIDIDTIINTVAVPLIGAVPEDSGIIRSINTGKPIVLLPKKHSATAFINIAKRITGRKVPIMKDEKRGLFSFFRRKK
jgi:septum site-determining protein MinD